MLFDRSKKADLDVVTEYYVSVSSKGRRDENEREQNENLGYLLKSQDWERFCGPFHQLNLVLNQIQRWKNATNIENEAKTNK